MYNLRSRTRGSLIFCCVGHTCNTKFVVFLWKGPQIRTLATKTEDSKGSMFSTLLSGSMYPSLRGNNAIVCFASYKMGCWSPEILDFTSRSLCLMTFLQKFVCFPVILDLFFSLIYCLYKVDMLLLIYLKSSPFLFSVWLSSMVYIAKSPKQVEM